MPAAKLVCLDVKYTVEQVKETGKVRLKAQVTLNTYIPSGVFLFTQNLDETVEFCTVATVAELECYPTLAPGKGSPFFRLDNVCLDFDTAKEMKEALDALRSRLEKLTSDYQILVCELGSEFTETYKGNGEC